MPNDKLVVIRSILLGICMLLSACAAGQTSQSAVGGGQLIDMGTYAVNAPLGETWRVQTDTVSGMVTFKDNGPEGRFSVISVLPGTWRPGTINQTEDEIAKLILGGEERNMTERGATRSYSLSNLSKEVTTIDGKRLYVMSYTITDRSKAVPIEIKYAMYLYLPPNFAQRWIFYGFLIGQAQKIGGTAHETDLTRIGPVINSFHSR